MQLRDGRAEWYRNRWVRSAAVAEELGEPVRGTPGGADFAANTNVLEHAGRTLALVEAGAPPYELTHDLDTVGQIPGDRLPGVREVPGEHHAAAVVTAADGLDDNRGAGPLGERVDIVDGADRRERRNGCAEDLQASAHDQLVLGMNERLRRRSHRHPLGDQPFQVFGRHVFVVEGQHRRPLRGTAQGVQVGVAPDDHVRCDLRRRVLGCGGQHPQRLPERDGGLVGHSGELAPADHRDDGRSGVSGRSGHGTYGVMPHATGMRADRHGR